MNDTTGQASPPEWHYTCRDCEHEFQMPAPSGPTEEMGRTCPKCHSRSIVRTDACESEVCPPGG